ncbi:methylmalonyl-CoA mutase family protein [uncultured Sanguibacteroides sp.]|uniref:methylmalonyl-CoA mutase family protein n=1 Tax=uncultured Sanguibacteroides sp. TaxID=1635151 RepID=UPI0025DA2774|nr:methylmalonyl-CoA mutase family protein [uncultured Sanguibacteroides sp.]
MAENVHTKLFSEFAPNTTQEWMDKVTADLKGADFNKKLVWRTNEGFNVQPMYRLENMKDLKYLDCFPGEFPYVRGNKKDNNWFIRQDIKVENVAEANKKALDVLNRGVDSLGFVISDCKNFTKADMKALLKDICLDCIEINFVLCCNKVAILNMFKEVVSEKGIAPESIRGGINIDPITKLALEGKFCDPHPFNVVKTTTEGTAQMKNFKSIEVGGFVFNNSGASIVQELGFSLAAGVEYLDKLTDAGMDIKDIAPRMRFHFATGSKYFMEIAKLRAARFLWAKIVKAYNPCCDSICKMNIHAETSEWNKTVYDPNVNMLRTQTEAMSAILGGVDSFTVHPYDYIYECQPSELGERVARNQQLLLKEESHFGKIADVAGGSYYIEELTQFIAEAAWKLFLEVQEQGGMQKALESGFVQAAIKATAQKRDQDIANRKENFLGTNQFPNFNEKIDKALCSCILEPEDFTAPDAVVETLKPYRGTQAFEAMRLRTDMFAKENGHRPVVYMFPMGNLAMRKARAQFACNFFACAGFQVMDNNGFKTVEEGAKACLENKADIVVICSSDDEYATIAPEVYAALKDKAIIVVAGNPESRPELEAIGITDYVHVKCNVLEDLKGYQQKLGIK